MSAAHEAELYVLYHDMVFRQRVFWLAMLWVFPNLPNQNIKKSDMEASKMLKKIKINNYKMFRDFEMDFTDGVTLICGPNGSGKSALREVLYALTGFLAIPDSTGRMYDSASSAFPPNVFCRWQKGFGDHHNLDIELELISGDSIFSYELTLHCNAINKYVSVSSEVLETWTSGSNRKWLMSNRVNKLAFRAESGEQVEIAHDGNFSGIPPSALNNSEAREFGEMVSKIYPVHLNPQNLANYFEQESNVIGPNGEHFSAWFGYNLLNRNENLGLLYERCRSFIQGFVSANTPRKGSMKSVAVKVKLNQSEYTLELDELSDGQRVLFALYTILGNVPDGSTIILDEPENFLAPSELQPWLFAIDDEWEERGLQFIVLTHNPKTLNWYHKEAVIFRVAGDPPKIEAEANQNDIPLYETLSELEWQTDGQKPM